MSQSAEKKMYKTIVISDVHLGSKWSAATEATRFIRENSCERLILCGDIIDGWAILRGSKAKWKREHTDFIAAVLDISTNAEVIYVKGNHDDFLDRLVPLSFANISVVSDYTLRSGGKDYFVLHGDIFDNVTTSMRWLAKAGDVGYSILLFLNKIFNFLRKTLGLHYISFASQIKQRVKSSVSKISNFEQNLADLAHSKRCHGVICGHIHRPEIKLLGEVEYLNSGDWIESLSALVEDFDNRWSLVKVKPQEDK